jgi:serine acetyltransferase
MNSSIATFLDNIAIGESVAIGSNLVVGKNITNSENINTNSIYAKSIRINDAVIKNTVLTNVFIDKIPILSKAISFISNLSSDVQL